MNSDSFVITPCVVCGGRTFIAVCTADEIAGHLQYLRQFHRRRLRSAAGEGFTDRATFTQDYVTDVVACKYCGLVLRAPHPSAPAITQAYEHDHYGQKRLATLFAAQLHSYRSKARTLRRWLPGSRSVRVLEVGSFVGGFLAAGQEQGWEMLGVDPGAEVSAFCQENGLPIFCGTLSDLSVKPHSIDGIAIWNTFDQLPDPIVTITTVCQMLRPGGILVIRVPNGECFRWAMTRLRTLPWPLAGWLRVVLAWNNLLAFPYLYGYSVPTLDRLLRGYGFTQRVVRYDTLLPLADKHTKVWATIEERLLKYLCTLAARIKKFGPATPIQIVPWLDVYYQFASTAEIIPQPLVSDSESVTMPQWRVA